MRWPHPRKRHPAYRADTSKVPLTTPYEQAASVWDSRIGTARVQARNWRLAALTSLLIALVSVTGAVYVAVHRPLRLHVVEVDPHGKPGRILLADAVYSPEDAHVGYLVSQLVELVRERPLDPVVLRQNWEKAYRFLAGDAVPAMNAYAENHSGLDAATSQDRLITRTVETTSVLKRAPHTYQVHWVETQYESGVVASREPYTGVFHIKLDPPRNESELFRNPLGLYVVHFQWSRDFTPQPENEDSTTSQAGFQTSATNARSNR